MKKIIILFILTIFSTNSLKAPSPPPLLVTISGLNIFRTGLDDGIADNPTASNTSKSFISISIFHKSQKCKLFRKR